MLIVNLLVNSIIAVALIAPSGEAAANDDPNTPAASSEDLSITDEVDPTEARYPPGHCYGAAYGGYEDIKGQCIAYCSGYTTGVVVSKRYVSVEGAHDQWCENRAERFCDAFALSLDYWCWGEEYD